LDQAQTFPTLIKILHLIFSFHYDLRPNPKDIKELSDLLSDNQKLELWRDIASAGDLAEIMIIENANATAGLKECWKHRLQVMKKDLGYDGASMLEQLLINRLPCVG
jgi:hypothetical protein